MSNNGLSDSLETLMDLCSTAKTMSNPKIESTLQMLYGYSEDDASALSQAQQQFDTVCENLSKPNPLMANSYGSDHLGSRLQVIVGSSFEALIKGEEGLLAYLADTVRNLAHSYRIMGELGNELENTRSFFPMQGSEDQFRDALKVVMDWVDENCF